MDTPTKWAILSRLKVVFDLMRYLKRMQREKLMKNGYGESKRSSIVSTVNGIDGSSSSVIVS